MNGLIDKSFFSQGTNVDIFVNDLIREYFIFKDGHQIF
jgi:hypothetical protein